MSPVHAGESLTNLTSSPLGFSQYLSDLGSIYTMISHKNVIHTITVILISSIHKIPAKKLRIFQLACTLGNNVHCTQRNY